MEAGNQLRPSVMLGPGWFLIYLCFKCTGGSDRNLYLTKAQLFVLHSVYMRVEFLKWYSATNELPSSA